MMIKVTYEAGIDLVEIWIKPEKINFLKKVLRKGVPYEYLILLDDRTITIDEDQFNSILAYFNAKLREEKINQILED